MRCDASWRGGESCFSPVCCSLQLEEEEEVCVCVCVSLPLLICCLFCFLSVLSPKRFGKVQISVLTAQCSKRKGEKQKGWRHGGGGRGWWRGGSPAARPGSLLALARPGWRRPLALTRLEERGDRRPGQGLPLRTQGRFGGLFLLGVPRVSSATSAQMGRSSTLLLCWPSALGGEGWNNMAYSSSCKIWAEALGENPRGS